MAGYVEQVDDHVVVVEPVEVEAVTSEDVGRQVARGHRDLPGHLGEGAGPIADISRHCSVRPADPGRAHGCVPR